MSREREKKPNWVGLVIFLLIILPEVAIPIGILAGIGYAGYRLAIQNKTGPKDSPIRFTTRSSSYENCRPKPFCFHKDKGIHHVRRGKEIDPWDRPDIDIRKYQRRS